MKRLLLIVVLGLAPLPACVADDGGQAESAERIQEPAPPARGGRVAPPRALACDRNQLTSYNGLVTEYQFSSRRTVLTIGTDWGTTETVVTGPRSELQWFLLNGQPMTADGWVRVESSAGSLQPGLRAIAWVCADESIRPVIDWRPE